MLAYRHLFHAGAFMDVFKHALLAQLVLALGRKGKPYFCLDTHAGTGRYDLTHPWAQKNAEYKDGSDAPKYPSMFMRTARSFVGHNTPLVRPRASHQLDYEGEVALVIGKPGRHITERAALDHIAAVTLCNEGTIRDWIRHAKFNVTQGKNFDSTGSLGPWLVPYTDEAQIADIRLTTRVNGETRQDDRTSRLIFGFRYLINYISTFTTLVPGDIIVTGTPTGAGARFDPPRYLKPGDLVEVEADGIGLLRNGVIDEAPQPHS